MLQYDKLHDSIKKQNQSRSDENTFFQVLNLNVAYRVSQRLSKQLPTVIIHNSD